MAIFCGGNARYLRTLENSLVDYRQALVIDERRRLFRPTTLTPNSYPCVLYGALFGYPCATDTTGTMVQSRSATMLHDLLQ